ncbi:MAG: hypothetical protein K2Y14_01130 [Burkholderiales bacterium]|nr:hypothetical protein [Burkholderiales bacterium]
MKHSKKLSGLVNSLSDDDLNCIELNMVSIIRSHIKSALVGTKYQKNQSILWIYEELFQPGKPSLQDCCHVLNMPHELIRIRMQCELYKNNIAFNNIKCNLPVVLNEEITYHCNKEVVLSAMFIWQNPGVIIKDIDKHFINSRLLIERNLVVVNSSGQLWMTCRNPNLNHNIHWTKCWSFYD